MRYKKKKIKKKTKQKKTVTQKKPERDVESEKQLYWKKKNTKKSVELPFTDLNSVCHL